MQKDHLLHGVSQNLLRVALRPPKKIRRSPNPVPVPVTLFGNRMAADVSSLDEVTVEEGACLIRYTHCPHQETRVADTQGRKPRGHQAVGHGFAHQPPEARKRGGRLPPTGFRGSTGTPGLQASASGTLSPPASVVLGFFVKPTGKPGAGEWLKPGADRKGERVSFPLPGVPFLAQGCGSGAATSPG